MVFGGGVIGVEGQRVREVRFYLAKFVPDLVRNEPLNCGLVVRAAELDKLFYRFLNDPPGGIREELMVDGYRKTIADWKNAIEKHGTRSLHFVGKRNGNKYANPALYIELAFSRMIGGRVDFKAAFERLVLPERIS